MSRNIAKMVLGLAIIAGSVFLTFTFKDPRYLWLNAFLLVILGTWD